MSESIEENKEIIIDLNSEYKIKIEDVEEFETSIFNKVFHDARERIKDIITHPESKHSYDTYNNIIAFTGERGKGKSSSMISFLRGLNGIESGNKKDLFFTEFYDNSEAKKAKYQFITLDVIDPSLFRGKESLFEIVLAKMFSLFKLSLDKGPSNNHFSVITDEERRELVKHFQNVFENLKYTTGNLKDELYKQEALDALIKLSTSSNLRESFQKLIKCYLRVLGKQEKCENFLVIAIDDFDLKIDGVYDMLEDVRQFLISEKIIILIACKMEQMQEAIEMSIYTSFTAFFAALKNSSTIYYEYDLQKENKSLEIELKAKKYIEKLFPITRQISLPNTENIDLNKILKNVKSNSNDLKILEVIYNKTNVFLQSSKFMKSVIYDETLRSLVNLFHSIDSANFHEFTKYCKSQFSQFLSRDQLDLLFNCDIYLLNTNILKIYQDDFFSHFSETQRDNLKLMTSSLNYELIQNADVTSYTYILDKSLNITNTEINRFNCIKIIYNLRNIMSFNSNPETSKMSTISGFFTSKFLSQKNRIPQTTTRKNRDYFKVQRTFQSNQLNNSQLIVIGSFIQNFGERDNEYLLSDENIFLNSINRSGGRFNYYYFSIFTFLNSPSNISQLFDRFAEKNELIAQIEKTWSKSVYSKLFNSPEFVSEFYNLLVETYRDLSKNGQFKADPNEDLHNQLVILFSKGIDQVFKKMNVKYQYLQLDFNTFLDHHYVIKLFIDMQSDNAIKEFVNDSFKNAQYEPLNLNLKSLDDIYYVTDITPLKSIVDLIENTERLNRSLLKDLINRIHDQDSDLKDFLNEPNYFESLFNSTKRRREINRLNLIKQLKRIIENGQSEEQY